MMNIMDSEMVVRTAHSAWPGFNGAFETAGSYMSEPDRSASGRDSKRPGAGSESSWARGSIRE
jgi:hypothetical protein